MSHPIIYFSADMFLILLVSEHTEFLYACICIKRSRFAYKVRRWLHEMVRQLQHTGALLNTSVSVRYCGCHTHTGGCTEASRRHRKQYAALAKHASFSVNTHLVSSPHAVSASHPKGDVAK